MEKFIILASFTKQGIEKIKDSPSRLEAAKKAFAAYGAELKEFYLVMGRYDMVVIAEAPDAETMAQVALAIASGGSVRTESLRAFREDEYREIIAAV